MIEPVVVVNLIVCLCAIWIAMYVNYNFIATAKLNEHRFAFFALRDELTRLAMGDVIKEDSEEYLTLMRLINANLSVSGNFRLTQYLHALSSVMSDEELRDHLDHIYNRIHNNEMPEQYKSIVAGYAVCAEDMYNHQTWLFFLVLIPLRLLFLLLYRASRAVNKGWIWLNNTFDYVEYQTTRLQSTKRALTADVQRFAIK